MTELIVALDGPEPLKLLLDLRFTGVTWFKVGPLTLTDPAVNSILVFGLLGLNLFYDAKLADHGPYVCTELAKRLGADGYAALSTSTDEATEATVRGAEGTPLKVWKHVAPTSQKPPDASAMLGRVEKALDQGAHGIICGVFWAPLFQDKQLDIVCPGIRVMDGDDGGHAETWGPSMCHHRGVTHAVVGRPIWQSSDPVAAAKWYLEELR